MSVDERWVRVARRTAEEAARTRAALVVAARTLVAEQGSAAASTPAVADAAGVTRGALYHHFADKRALLMAVVEAELAAVADAVDAGAAARTGLDVVLAGGDAYLDAMRDPGRRRILLVEAPAALGPDEVRAMEARHAGRTLAVGVAAAVADGTMRPVPAGAGADLLDAAFDRATLTDDADHRAALRALLDGLRA